MKKSTLDFRGRFLTVRLTFILLSVSLLILPAVIRSVEASKPGPAYKRTPVSSYSEQLARLYSWADNGRGIKASVRMSDEQTTSGVSDLSLTPVDIALSIPAALLITSHRIG